MEYLGFISDELTYQYKLCGDGYEHYEIYKNDELIITGEFRTNGCVYHHIGSEFPDLKATYKAILYKGDTKSVVICNKSGLFKSKHFIDNYTYTGQLGGFVEGDKTIFRVWSPISTKITLRLYKDYLNGVVDSEYDMYEIENGVFEYVNDGNLHNTYYNYVVTNDHFCNKECVDPYAKGVGLDGNCGLVVDFSKVEPEGFSTMTIPYQNKNNLVVYESHIADLTSSSTHSGGNKRTYKGFIERGTTYNGVTTGFDHIIELGVNAVQLLPIFDHENKESEGERVFNWGYDPKNYNALEGIYTVNPSDGLCRIREFRELVYEFSKHGVGIIMDVVYNHMNSIEASGFNTLMPYYYFRYHKNMPLDGSMCGNETASEMPMYRKFMIDSVVHFATTYKLIGFRFDLMGVHDLTTMKMLSARLHEIDPRLIVYGEPWSAKPVSISGDLPCNLDNTRLFEGYGCFNDKIRDALIKGGLNENSDLGYITNDQFISKLDKDYIHKGIRGKNNKYPMDICINYATCHDNYTLYDRIKAAGVSDEATVKKMAMLANSMILTSFGTSFILSGEEFLRTKGGNENSYNAPYEVNELDYNLKVKNLDMFENYKKLIALKKNPNVFNEKNLSELSIVVKYAGALMYYDLIDEVEGVKYRIIHSNGISCEKLVNLSGYTIYLSTVNKNLSVSKFTEVEPYETIIACKKI